MTQLAILQAFEAFHQPSAGETEKYICVQPRTAESVSSSWQALKEYEIPPFGKGFFAVSHIITHIISSKLGGIAQIPPDFYSRTIALTVDCSLKRNTGQPFESTVDTLSKIDPAFADAEGQERGAAIEHYARLISQGQDLGFPLYITGTALGICGGVHNDPNGIYMIDGARRISASVLAGKQNIKIMLLISEVEYASHINPRVINDTKNAIAGLSWFNTYQDIPLVGISGERSLTRFSLMDMTLLRDARIMDFGCNLGQACIKATMAGAREVWGVEGMPDTFSIASQIGRLASFPNLHYININFNDPDFDTQIDLLTPGSADYSFFFSVYRTKELTQRDRLFKYIIGKTTKGIFFEGHADPKIDSLEYYGWLFETFGLTARYLGNSEGSLRPLFFIPLEGRQRIAAPQAPTPRAPIQVTSPSRPDRFAVSAIVSTYQNERFIEGRLQDLLAQTLGDQLEIIVVDSGSPENEGEIVRRYAAQHANVKYIRTAERETVYQAWNRGIQASSGRYVTNANTDDRLRPDALQLLAAELDAHPEIALVYADFFITGYENMTFPDHVRTGYSRKPDYEPSIMLHGCHMGPQPLWRRTLHDQLGFFDVSLKAAGDYEFWCRVACRYPMKHLPEFLGLYLHNPSGIINSNTSRAQAETQQVRELYQTRLPTPRHDLPTGFYFREAVAPGRYVNIGMVTYNRLEFTRQAVEALVACTDFPYLLTVVDNASSDGTREYLQHLKHLGVIKNLVLLDQNVGVAKAANLAWSLEPEAGYFLKLDNDIVIQKPGWLSAMVEIIDVIPEMWALGYNFEPASYPVYEINGRQIRPKTGNLGGACFLVPRRTHEKLGFWCEDYGLYGEEDYDYGTRIALSGKYNAYMVDENIGIHLPAGRAAVIDEETYCAKDGLEESHHAEYRLFKDEQRRANVWGGLVSRNIAGYQDKTIPLYHSSGFAGAWLAQGAAGSGVKAAAVADDVIGEPEGPPVNVVIISLDGPDSACAQIRLRAPMNQLAARISHSWAVTVAGQECSTNLEQLDRADVIVVQRFYPRKGTAAILERILNSGKPVIYEADDLLFELPGSNELKPWADETTEILRQFLPRCSAITVSTPALRQEFSGFATEVLVLPNTVNAPLFQATSPRNGSRITIGCCGTNSHSRDLGLIDAAIFRIAQEYGDRVDFVFMGYAGKQHQTLPGFRYVDFELGYHSYAQKLAALEINIALVPLEDNRFNRCKSNIKWLEYSACGYAGIYADLAPYNSCIEHGRTGLLVGEGPEQWYRAISLLIENNHLRRFIASTARNEVLSRYSLATNAHKWLDAYRSVIGNHASTAMRLKISIIVLAWNRPKMLDQCLAAITSRIGSKDCYELIVGDNGSGPETLEVLAKYKIHKFIPKATNEGLELYQELYAAAAGDVIIEIDDDVIDLPADFDLHLANHLDLLPEYGLIGLDVVQNEHTNGAKPDGRYYEIDTRHGLNMEQGPVVGCCMAIRRVLFHSFGGFSGEKLTLSRSQDWVLADRVQAAGLKIGIISGLKCFHACGPYYASLFGDLAQDVRKYRDSGLHTLAEHYDSYARREITAAPEVSIIIPLYNKVEFSRRCLKALEAHTPAGRYELILVDNGSTDATGSFLDTLSPGIKVLKNKVNMGFAKACNQGARVATSDYLLFLNNDTEPQPGWLEPLLRTAWHDTQVAAVGSKLLFPDGTIQHAGVILADDRPNLDPLVAEHVYYALPAGYPEANVSRAYQTLTAACLLVRRSAYEAVQEFDEGYWNGYEDVDLCFKLGQKGWSIIYQPESVVVHYESKSGKERLAKAEENIARLHAKWLGVVKPEVIVHPDYQEEWRAPEAAAADAAKPLVSIIIPVFNQADYTRNCLTALFAITGEEISYEVIVVDNASTDWTPEYLKSLESQVVVHTNERNLGFAKACNQGARAARGRYVVFLNNDTLPGHGWLAALVRGIQSEGANLVGAKLLYPDGTVQHAGVGFAEPGNPVHVFKGMPGDHPAVNRKRFMQSVTGACLLMARRLFIDLGLFNEGFVNGYEDVDFCLRARAAGKNILYNPESVLTHFEEKSAGRKEKDQQNARRFAHLWQGKIPCDDLQLYEAEGLLDPIGDAQADRLFRLLGANGNALFIYHNVLTRYPDDLGALLNLGRAFAFNERPDDARLFLERVLQLCPGHGGALRELSLLAGRSSKTLSR